MYPTLAHLAVCQNLSLRVWDFVTDCELNCCLWYGFGTADTVRMAGLVTMGRMAAVFFVQCLVITNQVLEHTILSCSSLMVLCHWAVARAILISIVSKHPKSKTTMTNLPPCLPLALRLSMREFGRRLALQNLPLFLACQRLFHHQSAFLLIPCIYLALIFCNSLSPFPMELLSTVMKDWLALCSPSQTKKMEGS